MKQKQKPKGFSLIELMVVMAIMMVIGAFSTPAVLRSVRLYRLNNTIREVSNMLQRARYQAIALNRTNPPLACRLGAIGGRTAVYIDLDNDSVIDNNEPVTVLPSDLVFLGAGVAPSPASMGYALTQQPAGSISFNARGLVFYPPGAPQAVLVVFIGYPGQGTYGYRAISVTPVGKSKTWSADQGGVWRSQ